MAVEQVVGTGKYTYEADKHWGRGASGVPDLGVTQGVTGDSKDRIYIFQRSPKACMLIFDRNGKLLESWDGGGEFVSPHGIWCSPQDELYITDTQSHCVSKWTLDGKLLRSWGTHKQPGEWGVPFNRPTKAFVAPDGEMYVSDGYGNKHIHRYDKSGELIGSWGDKGDGPGQFVLPHDVWIDHKNQVLICDRENKRVQVFDRDGKYISEFHDQNPMQIFVRDGVMYMVHAYAQVSVRTEDGQELARWNYESVLTHDKEKSPHSVWVDSHGDIYVAEVVGEGGFQKFTRQ